MPSTLSSFLAYLTAWGGVIFLINRISKDLENVVKEDSKRDLVDYVTRSRLVTIADGLLPAVSESFENIFSRRNASIKCVLSSSLLCYLAVLLSCLVWLSQEPEDLHDLVSNSTALPRFISGVLIVTTISATLPSYFGVFKTRQLLQVLARRKNIFIPLVADLFLSAAISGAVLLTLIAPIEGARDLHIFRILSLSKDATVSFQQSGTTTTLDGIEFVQAGADFTISVPLGIWFYAAFLPSIWVWAAIVFLALIRILSAADSLKEFLGKHLDTNARPIVSVGWIANAFITILFATGYTVTLLN